MIVVPANAAQDGDDDRLAALHACFSIANNLKNTTNDGSIMQGFPTIPTKNRNYK